MRRTQVHSDSFLSILNVSLQLIKRSLFGDHTFPSPIWKCSNLIEVNSTVSSILNQMHPPRRLPKLLSEQILHLDHELRHDQKSYNVLGEVLILFLVCLLVYWKQTPTNFKLTCITKSTGTQNMNVDDSGFISLRISFEDPIDSFQFNLIKYNLRSCKGNVVIYNQEQNNKTTSELDILLPYSILPDNEAHHQSAIEIAMSTFSNFWKETINNLLRHHAMSVTSSKVYPTKQEEGKANK